MSVLCMQAVSNVSKVNASLNADMGLFQNGLGQQATIGQQDLQCKSSLRRPIGILICCEHFRSPDECLSASAIAEAHAMDGCVRPLSKS